MTWNGGIIIADIKGDVGKSGVARENVSSNSGIVDSTRDSGVISVNNFFRREDDCSTGVCNNVDINGIETVRPNDITVQSEFPLVLTCDGHEGYISSIFGIVDETEVITAGLLVFQICRKERSR